MKRFMVIWLAVMGCLFSCTGCSSLGPTQDKHPMVVSLPETKTEPAAPVVTHGNPNKSIPGMVNLFAAFLIGPNTPVPPQPVDP